MTFLRKFLPCLLLATMFVMPMPALADGAIVDKFNLAPFVPIVLDAMMTIASGGYDFFVGNGTGIIYLLVWGFLGLTIAIYLIKLYLPKNWLGTFGFSGGDEILDGKADPQTIVFNVLKPCFRAIIAAGLLLQIRPVILTEVLVNPFLQFGSLYTHSITETIQNTGVPTVPVQCPESIVQKAWISKSSCDFLIRPVSDLSIANNTVIKRGFEFLSRGLSELMTLVPHGGSGFLNVITGLLLISTFFASNLFMALLIIQGIFEFGMALILYPFQVLSYVVKPNDKWLDIWPAFSGVTNALKKLVITMIMCAFMLGVNIAIIKSLFTWNTSIFVVAANGTTNTNVPIIANTTSGAFGEHSILWLSSILTFYLMFKLFNLTREQLNSYAGKGTDALYKNVISDSKTLWGGVKNTTKAITTAIGWKKK
ncbi:MAG: hypothetical protein J5679_01115 [Alphaproteobacteria bacterium]|nr:hypothetical protein [Alphaproteobacteria bacterium]